MKCRVIVTFVLVVASLIVYLQFLSSVTIDTTNLSVKTIKRVEITDRKIVRKNVWSYRDGPDPEAVIDLVYAWVNGSDPRFKKSMQEYLGQLTGFVRTDVTDKRYNDKEELRYSLRSVEKFFPWFRKVFIVTNGQIPYWLNTDYDRVQIITHDQIFQNKDDLPTFSSTAIEHSLHRIPGLSKQFIYLNDDMMFGAPIERSDFIHKDGKYLVYLGTRLDTCSRKCEWTMIHNGHCDKDCHNPSCQMDGGDCETKGSSYESKSETKDNLETVDTYLEALRNGYFILNERYGYKQRYAPAHGPIMLDVDVMTEMQETFPDVVRRTQSHKLRNEKDVQMAMLYNYFLVQEKVHIQDIFANFDINNSSIWEDNEIDQIDIPVHQFWITCGIKSKVSLVNIVNSCSSLKEALMSKYGSKMKYDSEPKHADKNFLQFVMIRSLMIEARILLQRILLKPSKLICINDNLDSSQVEVNKLVLEYLRQFYEDFLPERSQFELPENITNKYLHVDEYYS